MNLREATARVILALAAAAAPAAAGEPPVGPSQFLGIQVGGDRVLADYHQILAYLRYLADHSDRVEVQSIGTSTLGEEMVAVVVSDPANLAAQEAVRETARRLADPRGLTPGEVAGLTREGRLVVFLGCNLHSTEIASSQLAMEWVHALAVTDEPERLEWLREVVVVLVPSLNPDGQLMVTNWYRTHLGTPFEGSRMPWLYHPYVGHDNNRDWFMLTQAETRAVNRLLYHRWHPQLIVDLHQMVGTGPRMFVPPYADPVSPRIHPLVWRNINLLGMTMAWRAEQAGQAGVVFGYWFDAFWPGSLNTTGWFKNIPGFWLEVASVRVATPVFIEPTDLVATRKGMVRYGPQSNFPNPWRGGWWRLRDIMNYQTVALDAILATGAAYRRDLLADAAVRAQAAVDGAASGSGYRVPLAQPASPSAVALIELLREHGVEVLADAHGDGWVPLAQPYRPLIEELLEVQRYPLIHPAAGADPLRPYDVTAWSLPLMMGVTVERRPAPPEGALVPWEQSREVRGRGDAHAGDRSGSAVVIPAAGAEVARVVNCVLGNGGVVRWRVEDGSRSHAEKGGEAGGDDGSFVVAGVVPAPCRALAAKHNVAMVPNENAAESQGIRLRRPRVGLYRPWAPSIDEGWSRWVLEEYGFAPEQVDNTRMRSGGGLDDLDVLILPDMGRRLLVLGAAEVRGGLFPEPPPAWGGGIGADGVNALRRFVTRGGTLLAWNAAVPLVVEEFPVTVGVVGRGEEDAALRSPGALARVTLAGSHPVTAGVPADLAVFVNSSSPALTTTIAETGDPRWVLARYPDRPGEVELSGWLQGAEAVAGRAAAVAARVGKGRVVLLGFRPLHRAQTHATFPLVFNTLYWSTLGAPERSR